MLIREGTIEDVDVITEIHTLARKAAYDHFFPADYLDGLGREYLTNMWRERILEPGSNLLVAELGGIVVGHVRFGPAPDIDEPTGEVYQLHVHPDFWRRSIGSTLLDAALERLRALGYAAAVLNVFEDNENGRGFYEHEGWRFDGFSFETERGGTILRQLRYRRSTVIA
jgi:ribosomal protein S18 acetylase RimI-like enzyme